MAILPLSVPHTGTRFTEVYLKTLNVVVKDFAHVDDVDIEYLLQHKHMQVVLPLADPVRCWDSHWREKKDGININHRAAVENLTRMICRWYGNLQLIEEAMPHVHLRVDGPAEERPEVLKKVRDFLGVEEPSEPFKWRVIGGGKGAMRKPYAMWNSTARTLKPDIVEYVLNELKPYRERYAYV